MEAGGVEPPSEKAATETSPGAARTLNLAAVAPTGRVYLGHLDALRLVLRELDQRQPGLGDALPFLPGRGRVGRLPN